MSQKKLNRKNTKKKATKKVEIESYRYESATRKNIPTAKIAAEGTVPRVAKAKYAYSAHLSPELRFDASGQSDRITDIVEKAIAGNKLTRKEADVLRGVAANASQPWLEWSGKKEEHDRGVLEVEPVALHIHERVSANAIIRAAKREDVQADLFADPKQEYKEAIQFYQHDFDWANRLILGDSLEVMSSLLSREGMAEQVQTIYIDPPYGIKYSSNFQNEVGSRDVKDGDKDLSREPEMVKAYRDTWVLGYHSYLSYLRDRLIPAHRLLTNEGSVFVQISDENLHRVRQLLDEVFGPENFMAVINWRSMTPLGQKGMARNYDYVIWYAKNAKEAFVQPLFVPTDIESEPEYSYLAAPGGNVRKLSREELRSLTDSSIVFKRSVLTSSGYTRSCTFEFDYQGAPYKPLSGKSWRTTPDGIERLKRAERLVVLGKNPYFRQYHGDFGHRHMENSWHDTAAGFSDPKMYVVQTHEKIIQRCMLMTSRPGDLILDPTCGGGTTAAVAEQWGRRWITIDSSRIAVSLARQRLLTKQYPYYQLMDPEKGPSGGFLCKTLPHVQLGRDIGQNQNLDPILDKYDEILDGILDECNVALRNTGDDIKARSVEELASLLENDGLNSVDQATRRKLLLLGTTEQMVKSAFAGKSKLKDKHVKQYCDLLPNGSEFEHWEVPFEAERFWPEELCLAVESYVQAWQEKMKEVNECISASADQEMIVDQPRVSTDILRVSGPFTVEGVRPEELTLDENGALGDPTPNERDVSDGRGGYAQNASAYLDRMIQLLRQDGVTFPNNEHRNFSQMDGLDDSDSALHAEALWVGAEDGVRPNIAIAFGPQHGPVTASQVEDLIRASRRYDELVIAAFSFDGSAQAVIQESANPRLKIHMAHIRPDASPGMDGLLKDSTKSQLFTVFGQPEIDLHEKNGELKVELLGVDIYSPLTGEILSSGADKVAAWFLDSDYDGRCFCTTQAFFPNQKAWDKIAKSLGSLADAEAFDAYNGTLSVPFEMGEHKRIAVKVIDPRGNEVMAIRSLKDAR